MKALLFDVYGVLIPEASPEVSQPMVAASGIAPELFWEAYWAERPDYDAGLSGREYWQRVERRVGQPISDIDAVIAQDVATNRDWIPAMRSYLTTLFDAGVRTGLLSNNIIELVDDLEASYPDFLTRFHTRVWSCQVGLAKPDPRIFDLAIAKMGVPASDILYIDDRRENVMVATTRGMLGHVFTSLDTLRPIVAAHLDDAA